MKLVIDSGGSSFKYLRIDDHYQVVETKTIAHGNLSVDFQGVRATIKQLLDDYPQITSGVFAFAGYATLTEAKQQQIQQLFANLSHKLIISDAALPLYASESDNVIAITLGTGTAVFTKQNDQIDQYLGYGFALGDLGSGFEIGKAILMRALLDNNQPYLDNIKAILGLLPTDDIVTYLWQDINTLSKKVASLTKGINNYGPEFAAFAKTQLNAVFAQLLTYLKTIVKSGATIVLNGGIFTNFPETITNLKATFPHHQVVLVRDHALAIGHQYIKNQGW